VTTPNFVPDPTAFRPMATPASRDLPVGFALEPVVRTISLEKSRIHEGWPGIRTRHCDYEAAHATGTPAPIANGGQVALVLGELFIKFFREGYIGGTLSFNLIRQTQLDDVLTAKGVITDKRPEGDRVRLELDVWLENQNGDKVLVGKASGLAD
jgi:acyl dehydratase